MDFEETSGLRDTQHTPKLGKTRRFELKTGRSTVRDASYQVLVRTRQPSVVKCLYGTVVLPSSVSQRLERQIFHSFLPSEVGAPETLLVLLILLPQIEVFSSTNIRLTFRRAVYQ